jgi:hypothetical protein
MAAGRRLGKSDLFLVRLWIEETENGAVAWCGKVQRPTTGEANLFHGWPGLIDLLLAMLSNNKDAPVGDHILDRN